ncbi:MAG: ATP-dependent DNA helicase RecG [Pseudomonadota bacterium]
MQAKQTFSSLPVVSLKGIGSQTAGRLEKLGIRTVQDLLFHLPLRYEDRTRIQPIGGLQVGTQALVEGHVDLAEVLPSGRRSLVCRISDATGYLTLRFFHFSSRLRDSLDRGVLLRCYGEVRHGYAGLEMVHPEHQRISGAQRGVTEGRLTPVYPLTEGVRQRTMRNAVQEAMRLWEGRQFSDEALADWIPQCVLKALHLPSLADALKTLHAPGANISHEAFESGTLPEQKRLAFEELLAHHFSLSRLRAAAQAYVAPPFPENKVACEKFLGSLPFNLTNAQRRVVSEIQADFMSGKPMMRLVQGDVGSGKTVVAAYSALSALSQSYQVAVMAPTELLAEQHYRNFESWLGPLGVHVVLLAGKLKGKRREEAVHAIAEGGAGVVIGTHALVQEHVRFAKLGYVVIDEQHRFGVHQRLALREKGLNEEMRPHQLVMTATPIPRTLAMLRFSDLDVSLIDELPPGRTPVVTTVTPASRRDEVIGRINDWVSGGRQVYWVCTLVEESEALQCEAAEDAAARLAEALPRVRVALLHGRMKPAEKDRVMQAFKGHQIDLLVATTVIEVGVDVPNAGLMVVENAERLGLSQLHQLRGRVGRGEGDSYCMLMYQPPLSDTARQRLSILRKSSDGFRIAEMDLQLRGPGEVMGIRQTGQIQLRIADLGRDKDLIPQVVKAAEMIQRDYPSAVSPLIERWLGETTQYGEV